MFTDKQVVLEQYKSSGNLEARITLHERFSTRKGVFHHWLFDHIQAPQNANVLELGAGFAKLWQMNRERIPQGWKVTLSDISEGMLKDAKKNVADIAGAFSFRVVDAQAIPFEDSSFDLIMANHMLYHVPNVDKAVSEVRRILKPGGHFYAATNSSTHVKELDDFVEEHMASKLPGVFSRFDISGFVLENGEAQLSKHFDNVQLHLPPPSYLHVTEAEPFMAYILSMARWSELVEGVSKKQVDEVVAEARKIAEKILPIYITTSAGLFEAW